MMFLYKIEFYDECLEREVICKGITEGETYIDAFNNIIDDYGHDNTENIHIAALTAKDEYCFEFEDEKSINDIFCDIGLNN